MSILVKSSLWMNLTGSYLLSATRQFYKKQLKVFNTGAELKFAKMRHLHILMLVQIDAS